MERERLQAIPAAITVLIDDGYRFWREGQLDMALAQLETALVRAAAVGSVAAMLSARHLLGTLAYERGDLEAASEHHLFVLSESERYGIAVGIASSLHNLGLVSAAQSDKVTVGQQMLAAADRYTRLGMGEAAAAVRANLAAIAEERPPLLRNGHA